MTSGEFTTTKYLRGIHYSVSKPDLQHHVAHADDVDLSQRFNEELG